MRPFEELPPADYKLFLESMRADRCVEYPLIGWRAVADWLHRMKFVQRPPRDETLRAWRKKFGMPVTHTARSREGKDRTPWTTNLMMQAWLGTQGRALSVPRWHPLRCEVEGRPFVPNPRRGIKGRRPGRLTAAQLAELHRQRLIAQATESPRASADTSRSTPSAGRSSTSPS